jgi:putative transposase
MARQVRVQFPGAIYHVMSRGDRREKIFLDDIDRQDFLKTLAECCQKTGFEVHAYCLMSNHFHLVVETPEPNLSEGMRWLLSSYTIRLNHRHKLFGHVFSGRYKAVLVQKERGDYFRTACDYVHLNPVRARLVSPQERMLAYPWSSLGWYLSGPAHRPAWIHSARLLQAYGVSDSPAGRERFEAALEGLRAREGADDHWNAVRQGWCLGDEEFRQEILAQIDGQVQEHHPGDLKRESAEARAERIITEELKRLAWTSADLALRLKTDPDKLRIAQRLRAETILSVKWIAARLHLGTHRSASTRLQELKKKTRNRRRK